MKVAVSNCGCVNEGMVDGIEPGPSLNSSNDVPHQTDTQYEECQDWAYIDKLNEEHAHEVKGKFNQRFYPSSFESNLPGKAQSAVNSYSLNKGCRSARFS